MDDRIKVEIEKLAELKRKLNEFEEAKYTTKITSYRGKVINKLKKIIKKLESEEHLSQDAVEILNNYKDELSEELFKHKLQLRNRYNEEFIHGQAKVPDILSTLPKGMTLQVQKVINTINEIKNAKGNKEKLTAVSNFAKQSGLLAATPAIFTGKFVIEHWYLILLLFRGNLLNWLKNLLKGKGKNDSDDEVKNNDAQPEESPDNVQSPDPNSPRVGKFPPIFPPLPNPKDGQSPEGTGDIPEGEPVPKTEGEPGFAVNEGQGLPDLLKTLQNKIDNAKGDLKAKIQTLKEIIEKIAKNNQTIPVPIVNGGDETLISSENIFTIEQQRNYLYEYAKAAYRVDSMGNGYAIYNNIEEYALQNDMSVEEAKEWLRTSLLSNGNITSIRFIVDNEFGLGFYNSEEEFINYLTNNMGLHDVDLNSQTMQQYLLNIEKIGNDISLMGTEFDQNPLADGAITEIIDGLTSKYGSTGVVLFILYEVLQYGLAYPTGGVTLALPG